MIAIIDIDALEIWEQMRQKFKNSQSQESTEDSLVLVKRV